ncbi:hypothetical protein C8Q78DRAFT_1080286 [Trametes maxima]|nr:hypothetical protein C8Q78DRAFT_1080286 [Trametes maxima]
MGWLALWIFLVTVPAYAQQAFDDQFPIQPRISHPNDHPIPCPTIANKVLDPRLRCGLFDVPLDWQNPELGNGRIFYIRFPASQSATRKGTIFIDSGHPVAVIEDLSSRQWLYDHGENLHNDTNGEYDIVAWDARGKGAQGLTIPGPSWCFFNFRERARFYATAAKEGSHRAPWDPKTLQFYDPQDDERINQWYDAQAKLVKECLAKQNSTMLRYVGTAATTRDLVAMADAFDGLGSPVNFWGMSYGSLIGNYLLRMFPKRAGRIVLDGLPDLESYVTQESYRTWKEDMSHANLAFVSLPLALNDYINGAGSPSIVKANPGTSPLKIIAQTFILARNALVGWQRAPEAEMKNRYFLSYFWMILPFYVPALDKHFSLPKIAKILHSSQVPQSFELGVMPIFCGDKLYEHIPETALEKQQILMKLFQDGKLLSSMLAGTAFPPLRYMCNIWPIRAAERLPISAADDFDFYSYTPPAHPFLVVNHLQDPLHRPEHVKRIASSKFFGENHVVAQTGFGTPGLAHSTCMNDVITSYFLHGTDALTNVTLCNGVPTEVVSTNLTVVSAYLDDSSSEQGGGERDGTLRSDLRWAARVLRPVGWAALTVRIFKLLVKRYRRGAGRLNES